MLTSRGEAVSYRQAFETLANWIKNAERPTIVLGPLVFWDFGEIELQERARLVKEMIEKVGRFNVKALPDYRPKLKKYDTTIACGGSLLQDGLYHKASQKAHGHKGRCPLTVIQL